MLAALATCQELTYRVYAALMDIPLEQISVDLEEEIDGRGLLGVEAGIRPDYEKIRGLTYGTTDRQQRLASRTSWSVLDVAASATVLALILAAYLYFRG